MIYSIHSIFNYAFIYKRLVDLWGHCLDFALLLPLLIVLAVAIKLDSKGPVLFKQGRRTKDGRIFKMWKFRSMVVNAESIGSGLFSYENDPRITKVGRFLRNTSLDELPQLFNVLEGSLSLVGPRPCVTYELGDFDTLNKRYKKRFSVKAGITGLAQARGRNENSWDEKVSLDNEYIDLFQKQGVWIDMVVLFETFINVFKSKDITESKFDVNMEDEESAKRAEEEIIRIAHMPD